MSSPSGSPHEDLLGSPQSPSASPAPAHGAAPAASASGARSTPTGAASKGGGGGTRVRLTTGAAGGAPSSSRTKRPASASAEPEQPAQGSPFIASNVEVTGVKRLKRAGDGSSRKPSEPGPGKSWRKGLKGNHAGVGQAALRPQVLEPLYPFELNLPQTSYVPRPPASSRVFPVAQLPKISQAFLPNLPLERSTPPVRRWHNTGRTVLTASGHQLRLPTWTGEPESEYLAARPPDAPPATTEGAIEAAAFQQQQHAGATASAMSSPAPSSVGAFPIAPADGAAGAPAAKPKKPKAPRRKKQPAAADGGAPGPVASSSGTKIKLTSSSAKQAQQQAQQQAQGGMMPPPPPQPAAAVAGPAHTEAPPPAPPAA